MVEAPSHSEKRTSGDVPKEGKAMKPIETLLDYHAAMARLEQIFSTARPGTPEGDEFEFLTAAISDWERRITTIYLNAEKWEAFQGALEAPPVPMPRMQALLDRPGGFDAELLHPPQTHRL